jgi:hypothetical protein
LAEIIEICIDNGGTFTDVRLIWDGRLVDTKR